MTDQNAADLISVPKGGGAISGIGETFQPDLHTGTGNLTIPLELPAGRNGLQPSLTLSYSTGNPNGPFGLGWALSVPGVRRKTDKGIPRYDPAPGHLRPVRRRRPGPGVRRGHRSGPLPAAQRGRLRPDHPRHRRRRGLLGGVVHRRAAQPLRHSPAANPAAGLGRPGGHRRPRPAGADLRLAAHRDRRPARQPDQPTPTSPTPRAPPSGTCREISYADYGDPASPQYLVTVKIILDSDAAARPVLRPPARVRAAHHPARRRRSKPGPRPAPRCWPAGSSCPTPTRPAPRPPTPCPC